MSELYLKIFHFIFFNTSAITAIIITVIFLLLLLNFLSNGPTKKYNLPPGPLGVPVLGYLPFLGKESFKTLDRLKSKYGNVFSLYMGRTYMVILADYEAVKEVYSKTSCLEKSEDVFSVLPDGLGFSNVNGEEWSEQRRFCMRSIRDLGVGKHEWEANIQEEIEDLIKIVDDTKGQPFDVSGILTSNISNHISFFVFGRRLEFNDPDRIFLDKAIDKIMQAFILDSVAGFFPKIRDLLGFLGIGSWGQARKYLREFNSFIRKEVDKQKSTYKLTTPTNFIEDYLMEMSKRKDQKAHGFTEKSLYGNVQGLYLAGSDTTRTSINWLLLAMAEFQDVQTKVYQELSTVFSKGEQITWSDRNKVPYTMATVFEGQRWKTIAPLNSPRSAVEDVKIQGYDIPKGIPMMANMWGLHHDKRYWKKPESFYPPHFLTEDGSQVTKPESYIPFSYGKRNCPGETIAMMEIFLYFAAIMLKFHVLPLEGQKVNMDAIAGLTYTPVKQKLRFISRKSQK